MKTISKKTVQLLGLVSIALALIIGFSCKKENTDPNNPDLNGGQSVQPLIASADINAVTEGEMIDFKCYYQKNYGEVINYGDTSLILRFLSTDKYGEEIDGPYIVVMIVSDNGFHQGDIFNLAEDEVLMAGVGDYTTLQGEDTAEIKITSLSGGHIKGTFKFTAQAINNSEVIVSNGKFQYDYYLIQ